MSALEVAVDYIARGWSPVPIPYMKKGPVGRGWPKLRITAEDAPKHFNGAQQNIGIIMGERQQQSGGCRSRLPRGPGPGVDLPAAHGAGLRAPKQAPQPLALHLGSAQGDQVRGPIGAVDPKTGEPKATMLVEVRSTGGQTVFPGSTHESGEAIQWDEEGDPAEADPTQLIKAVGSLAAACMLVRAPRPRGATTTCSISAVLSCAVSVPMVPLTSWHRLAAWCSASSITRPPRSG